MRLGLIALILTVLVIVTNVAESSSSQVTQQFQVTNVSLTATPQSDHKCPTTVQFSGQITANGKGRVTYTFIRSDGLTAPAQTLEFEEAGTKSVGVTRAVSSAQSSSGWQAIKILSPNSLLSERAPFSVDCGSHEKEGEPILDLRQYYYTGPRAYPATSIDEGSRVRAFDGLSAARNSSQNPHVNSEFKESPQAPEQAGASGCAWYSVGPTNINGRITSIAIDPNNNQHLFVASVGGIWRSKDGGRRWQRVSDAILATVFASVAVNPANGDEVFAGSGDPNYYWRDNSGIGIWRSLSGGAPGTWLKISPPEMDYSVIYRLRIDPAAPHNVYAATSTGVYLGTRDVNNVITWSRLGNLYAKVTDLVVDFSTTPRKVYAGVAAVTQPYSPGILKYDGSAWQHRDTGIDTSTSRTIALALAPSNPEILYAKVEDGRDGSLQGVYKTETGAEQVGTADAWTKLDAASKLNDSCFQYCYSWYNSIIEVDPVNPQIVYSGGLDLYRTTNGGLNWFNVSTGPDSTFFLAIHPDQHAIAFDPQNSKTIFVGNDGGIFKSGDTSADTWHWNNIAHGMVMTEFYKITSQQATTTLLAGGSQDNGTEITFGNRTWYNPYGCDGADVAVDGKNSNTLYANCNGGLFQLTNPIPLSCGGSCLADWLAPQDTTLIPPLVTDPALPGRALSAGKQSKDKNKTEPPKDKDKAEPRFLLKTVDGLNWTTIVPAFPLNLEPSFIAVAPSSSFQAFYVGLAFTGGDIDPATGPPVPEIWRTSDGGRTWDQASTGLPTNLRPNNCAVDYSDPRRAFAAFGGYAGGDLYMTTDGGKNWVSLFGVGAEELKQIAVTDVAIDPNNPQVVYIATRLGVFRGQITNGATPTASWSPFDEGLPDGPDVNAISVNRAASILSIGTMGHGVYQRDISPQAKCSGAILLVRDNVFDSGSSPSPNNVPDPEHPIPDFGRPGFFKPNDTAAGQVYWWTSPDIRFDVPSTTPAANAIPNPDHIEFETCAIGAENCPPGTLIDSAPLAGKPARVHIQVSNRGFRAASNVRVIALWADARAITFPKLPDNFWTTTFPAGSTNCGAIDPDSDWKLVDPAKPCQTIPVVNPDMPEVVSFSWEVPKSATSSCLLVIVESADDPIDPVVRASNETRLYELVPKNRQISLRNLQVVDVNNPLELVEGLKVSNPTKEETALNLIVSDNSSSLGDKLTLLLPELQKIESRGETSFNVKLSPRVERMASMLKVSPREGYAVSGVNFSISNLSIPAGNVKAVGIAYQPRPQIRSGPPRRITVLAKEGETVLGGITYVLRR